MGSAVLKISLKSPGPVRLCVIATAWSTGFSILLFEAADAAKSLVGCRGRPKAEVLLMAETESRPKVT